MKKSLALILLLAVTVSVMVSCKNKNQYEDITYKENGLYFVLPNTMRQKDTEDYDFYFSNELMNIIFMAKKMTAEILEGMNITPGISAGEYVDTIIERRDFEKSKIYYNYDENRDLYNFRYSYDDEEEISMFFYVTVTGGADNLWYIEMCCDEEDSAEYIPMFDSWRKTIGTY